MTPQEVIKTFMATLANHGYSYSNTVGKDMLDAAVKASSRFLDIQNVIDNMKAAQVAAEREAVEEVLGSEYAGKTMSEVSSSILKANASSYVDTAISNTPTGYTTTVKRVIQERKAYIFLEKYCGIQLNTKYWFYNDTTATYTAGNSDSGNVDTGAITGSDANITLKAGDVVYGTTLTSDLMQTLAKQNGISLSGNTLIVGTGTEKTANSVVPEIGNKYTATTSTAQNIKTGSKDWIVVATGGNDTITTGGADSIDAGAGNDKIIIGADYSSIVTGAGSDNIAVSSTVNNVTLCDLGIRDTVTVGGTFEVGSAQVDDSILIVTDKTGKRTVRFDNYKNAMNAKVNGKTLTNWLGDVTIRSANSQAFAAESAIADFAAATLVDVDGQITGEDYTLDYVEPGSLAEETQQLTATNGVINLNDVTIANGTVKTSSGTIGTISNEFPNISTFTKNGLTIKLFGVASDTSGTYGKVTAKTLDELTDAQKTIVAGLFKWWTKESLNLIKDSYGIDFNSDTAAVKEMELYFYDSKGSGNTLAAAGYWFNSSGKTIQQFLKVNMNYYKGIDADDVNGAGSSNAGYIDRTLAHEFTHSIMESNIIGFNKLPQFIAEGMAELTHGIDDFRSYNIFTLANDASKLNKALNINNTGTGETDAYAGGYMFLRYLAKQASLQSLVDYGSSDAEGTWEVNKTTATYKIDGTVVATINGLKSGIVATGTLIDGITVDGDKIILSQKVLGTSTVKLTNTTDKSYTLAFDEELSNNSVVTISGKAWTFSNGTATLKGNSSAGYNLSDDGKTVTYSAAKTNQTLATISGLAKTGVTANDFPTDSDVITLTSSMLGTSKITLKGDGYTLALDDSFNPQVMNPYWSIKGTTATYQYNTSAGFTLSEDGKAATYFKPVSTVLATVSGLKSGLTATDGTIDGITISGDKISLDDKVLGTSKVTVKGDYTLALDNSLTSPSTKNRWLVNGTTATYDAVQSDYFTPSDDGKTLTYNKEKVLNNFITVKGLAKGAKVDDNGTVAGVTLKNKTVTLAGNDLFGSKVEVKLPDGYTLDNQLTAPVATSTAWTVSKGTATLKQEMTDGYTLTTNAKTGVHTITYSAAKTGKNAVTLATISGLNTALKATDGTIDGITISGDKISLDDKVLGTSKVTLKGDYTLALDNSLTSPSTKNRWLVNGTTATYDAVQSDYFTPSDDGKTLTYNKEKVLNNFITVKGLAKGAKVDDNGTVAGVTLKNKTVTLAGNDLFGSKVEVKLPDGYTLDNQLTAPVATSTAWTVSKGTATLKQEMTDGYTLTTNAKTGVHTITYSAAKTGKNAVTLATISGLNTALKATDGTIDGITISGDKISLDDKVLGTSKVTLKGDYTLALDDSLTSPSTKNRWLVNGTTATYDAVQSDYFTPSDDGKTLTYNKEKVLNNFITIKGLAKGAKVDDNGTVAGVTLKNKTVTLAGNDLFGNKVEVKLPDGYTLDNQLTAPVATSTTWTVSKGTATLKQEMTDGYTLTTNAKTGVHTITYSAAKTGKNAVTLATISGLNTALKATDGTIDGITISGNKISLDDKVLGTSKVTVKGDYTLALDNSLTSPSTKNRWLVNGTTATYDAVQSDYFTPSDDGKTLTYNKEKVLNNFITVKGLAKGAKVDDNGTVAGVTLNDKKVTLAGNELFGSKVEVKLPDGYTLDNQLTAPVATSTAWTVSKGTATLKQEMTDGYTLTTNAKTGVHTITYSAAKTGKNAVTLATISGLNTALKATDGTIDGITISGNKIILSQKALGASKVTVKGDYTLALANDVAAPTPQKPYWTVSGTTATYKYDTTASFILSADGKTVDYIKPTSTTLATVSGLKKGLTVTNGTIDGIIVSGDKISLDDKVLGMSKVSVKGDYTLALDDSLTSPTTKNSWLISGTTATYDAVQSDYFTPSDDGKTLIYNKEKVLNNFITVKGLAKGAKVDDNGTVAGVTLNDKTVTLAGDDLFGNKVEVKLADGYTLNNRLTAPAGTTASWTIKDGTATLKQEMTAGYTLTTNAKTGVHTITYSEAKTGKNAAVLATVSGLNKTLQDSNGALAGLVYNLNDKTIMLDKRVLGTSNITVKGDYKLVPVTSGTYAIPTTTRSDTYWTVSGTKAVYKTADIGYFTQDGDKTLKYTKENVYNTHATISGLKNNAPIGSFSVSGNVITITANALDENPTSSTKITLGKNDTYTFNLGGGIASVEYNAPTWTYANGNATYSATVRTAGYSKSIDGKTITYIPVMDKKKPVSTTYATLSGVKSSDGIFVGDKVITVSEAALDAKKVTLSTNYGYKLAINSNVTVPTLTKTEWSTNNTTTANLIGTISAGYTVTSDKTISYSKTKTQTLATITGLANKTTVLDEIGTSDKEIVLSDEQLSKKVTISGDYKFVFARDYNDAAIVASAANDTITCAGSGLSITGGTGDDYIDFGTGGNSNTFIYASGDGNDVIADFSATKDKIKVTRGSISVKGVGNDVLITVDSGTIKLEGVAGQAISIIDRSGVEKQFPTKASSADLLESDNFISQDTRLDTITDNSGALDDLNATTLANNDLTTLTKQSNLVTYVKK